MSEITPNLRLPYIFSAQAQKHVTHNEAIRALDAVVQISVTSRAITGPPGSPADGVRYIIPDAASGAWSGLSPRIAAFQDGAWATYIPPEGWLAWVEDEDLLYAFDGEAWITANDIASVNPTPLLGVNATADETNRLAVSSPASLLNHAGAGHQQKINKHAAGDTASTLYQTNFSGRAEVGLAGDDNLHVKVSPDGSAWKEAIVVDRSTGAVTMPFSSFGLANPWAGKKWAALGTSITSQGFYTGPLATLLGATLVNQGVSGGHLSVPASGGSGLEIYDQVASIASDADLVTLEVSINDFGRASTLGALGDATTSTFYGALQKVGVDILAAHAQRRLVYITPYAISTTGYPSGANWNTANASGNTLAQFQQAVHEVAHRLGCPVVDMAESGISAQTASLFMSDGLHINTAGGVRMAQHIYDRLLFVQPSLPVVATPSFSPAAGTYEGTQSVTISCATSGATIYYTTNGTTPTTSSTLYSGAISVAASATVKAIAVKAGMMDSAVGSAAFTIITQVATPTFSPAAGTYSSTQSVTISCATSGATIYHTVDGSTPTTGSTLYSGAISVPATATLKALAVKSGLSNSAVGTAAYTISPAFSPADLSPAFWIDASDLSTLFQNTAGSTPVTADGQAVARANDKSGNGRNVTEASSGAQPHYKTDGTLHWLLYDGGDGLALASNYTAPGTSYAVAWASRKDDTGGGGSVIMGVSSGNWAGDNVVNVGQPALQANNGAAKTGGLAASTALADHVVVVNVNAGAASFYQNGTAAGTGSGVDALTISGLRFDLGGYSYAGRIYQAMLIPRALTGGEITSLSNWLKAKAGL